MKHSVDYKKEARKIRTKKIWRLISLIVIIFSLSISIFLGYRVLVNIDYFKIKTVHITTQTHSSIPMFKTVLNKYRGNSILTFPISVVKSKLEDFPITKTVVIKRKWPDALEVIIEERKAIAILNVKHSAMHQLMSADSEGVILAENKAIKTMDLPIITYAGLSKMYPADRIQDKAILNVLLVLEKLKKNNPELYNLVNEVNLRKLYSNLYFKIWMTDKNFPLKTENFNYFVFKKMDALLSLYKNYDAIQSVISIGSNLVLSQKI